MEESDHRGVLHQRLASSINEKSSPLKDQPTEETLSYEVQPDYLRKTKRKKYRFLMLGFCCCFVLGNYFCYDYPAALELQIEEEFNVSSTTYGLLYTGYAVPNLFMPVLGGILFDKVGTRSGLMLFTIILVIGQGLFTLGGYQMNFNLMFVARIIFGIGCEAMYVGQSAIVSEWFINYELPFAMSMENCVPLVGSFAGGAIVPTVYLNSGFGASFGVGFLWCLFGLVMMIIMWIVDRQTEKADAEWLEEYTA